MNDRSSIDPEILKALRSFDTCTIANAIEVFQVRLRNTGFTDASVRAMFPEMPPIVGYATTARVRTEDPPVGGRAYHDRTDWWNSICEIPEPRIVVLQDMDKPRGFGAFLGDMHAAILMSLGCVGFVTDGAARELPAIQQMGMQVFAGHAAVSHAYVHTFDFCAPVKVGGLEIHPGDLLHGDQHGIIQIPKQIAPQIPAAAAKQKEIEQRMIQFCQSKDFSLEGLRELLRQSNQDPKHDISR